jgi:hypothetical protein
VSLDVDRWYSSSQSPIKFEACRTSSRGRLFLFWAFSICDCRRFGAAMLLDNISFLPWISGGRLFYVKATAAEIRRIAITISLCLDEYAQFCICALRSPSA